MRRIASFIVAVALIATTGGFPSQRAAAAPPEGVVAGVVTDGFGNPLEGVLIDRYRWDDGQHDQWTSAADGSYSFTAAPGRLTLYFSFAGHLAPCWDVGYAACKIVDVVDGATATMDAELLPESGLVGTVRDSAGNPIAGVTVSGAEIVIGGGSTYPTTTTAADGSYTLFPVLPITQPIKFRAPDGSGLFDVTIEATPPPAGQLTLDAELRLGGSISGRVTDVAGGPAAGAWVTAHDVLDFYRTLAVQADGNGDYVLSGLAPGSYIVEAYGGSSAPTFYPGVDRAAAQQVTITDAFDGVSYPSVNGIDFGLLSMPTGTVAVLDQFGAQPGAAAVAICDSPSVPEAPLYEFCTGGPGGASALRQVPAGTIDYVVPGAYNLQAIVNGALAGPVVPLTVQAGQTFECQLRYEEDPSLSSCVAIDPPSAAVTITGRLVSSVDGTPLAGTVAAFHRSIATMVDVYHDTFTTAPDGTFSISVPVAEQWRLVGDAPGHVPLWGSFVVTPMNLPAGSTYDIGDVEMEPLAELTGVVTDGSGAPVEGVAIDILHWDSSAIDHVVTDIDGRYTLSLRSGMVTLTFAKAGHVDPCWASGYSGCVMLNLAGGVTSTQDIVMYRAATVTGTVTDPNGNPLADVPVTSGADVTGETTTLTAADGTYTLTGVVPVSQSFTFGATYGGTYAPIVQMATPPEAGTLVLDAQLRVGGTISGRVTDHQGNPVEGAPVYAQQEGYGGSATTDANGDYTIAGLAPNDYLVYVLGQGSLPTFYPSTDSLQAATQVTVADVFDGVSYPAVIGIDIEMLPSVSGTASVFDANGDPPIDYAYLTMCPAGYTPTSFLGFTCGDGAGGEAPLGIWPVIDGVVAVPAIVPGSYVVQLATASGFSSLGFVGPSVPLTVQVGQSFECVLRYEEDPSLSSCTALGPVASGLTVTGRLVSSVDGSGLAGTVAAYRLGPTAFFDDLYGTFSTAPDGTFSISLPQSSVWHLEGSAAGHLPLFGSFPVTAANLPAGSTYDIGDIVMEPLAELTGVVTDGAGAPVEGVEVDVHSWWTSTTVHVVTGADGRYTAELRAGMASLSFTKAGYVDPCWATGNTGCLNTSLVPGATSTLDVLMYQAATVTGTVTDPNGNPLADATVVASVGFWSQRMTQTAADGTYMLTGVVPVSQTFTFTPSDTTYAPTSQEAAPSEGGTLVLDAQLMVGGTISGRITDFDGNPVVGADVWVTSVDEMSSASAVTDIDGGYTITGLAPDNYLVGVYSNGRFVLYPGVTVEADAVPVTVPDVLDAGAYPAVTGIDIVTPAMVSGTATVLDANGNPPAVFGLLALCPAGYTPTLVGAFGSECEDGSGATVPLWGGSVVGGTATISGVVPGDYVAQVALYSGTSISFVGPIVPLSVQAGQSFSCVMRYEEDPSLSSCAASGTPIVVDGDGVPAATENGAPNGGDGNGDGTQDGDQANVSSLPSPSSGYVTVAGPVGTDLQAVTALDAASLPAAPGSGPSAVVGYTLTLNGAPSPVTVEVIVDDPAPTINTFFKYQGGVWVDATSLVSAFTPLGDGRTRVSLVLTDGGFGDEDGVVNGVIVDPGLFTTVAPAGYVFTGFFGVDHGRERVEPGSTVSLRYRLTLSDGTPVSDRSSLVAVRMASTGCGAADAIDTDLTGRVRLVYKGRGNWQIELKTDRQWRGCRTLRVELSDGTTHDVSLIFSQGGDDRDDRDGDDRYDRDDCRDRGGRRPV